MKRGRIKIFFFSLIFILYSLFSSKASAAVLFSDDFESGNDSAWTKVSGQNLWQVKEINGSKMYGASLIQKNQEIISVMNNSGLVDYVFSVDMFPVSGNSKDIGLRWTQDKGFCSRLHFNNDEIIATNGPTVNYQIINGKLYHIDVVMAGTHYQVSINKQIVMSYDDNRQNACTDGSAALVINAGTTPPTEVWFDNATIGSIENGGVINACPLGQQFWRLCIINPRDLGAFIGRIITFVFILAILIALGYLIWGGIKWITSQGDKSGVEGARNHIVAALIGLIIIFISYLILNLLIQFFAPGASLQNLQLPHL